VRGKYPLFPVFRPMIVETFFLVEEKRAMHTPFFQDLYTAVSPLDNSKKRG
jgi:hypothetical protein